MRVARGSSDATAVATRGSERRGKKLSLNGTKGAGATPVCARAMTHQRGFEGVDVVLAHDAVDIDGVQEPPVEPRAPSLEAELRRRRSALGARRCPHRPPRGSRGEPRGPPCPRARRSPRRPGSRRESTRPRAATSAGVAACERRCARGGRRRDAEGAKRETEGKAGIPGGRETAISSRSSSTTPSGRKWCTFRQCFRVRQSERVAAWGEKSGRSRRGGRYRAPRGDAAPCPRVLASDRARRIRSPPQVRRARTGRAREGTSARSARGKGICDDDGRQRRSCKGVRGLEHLRARERGGDTAARSARGSGSASTGGCARARSAGAQASASTGGIDTSARSAGVRASASTGGREASARSAAQGICQRGGSDAAARECGGSAFCELIEGRERSARTSPREHLRAREAIDTSARSAGATAICELLLHHHRRTSTSTSTSTATSTSTSTARSAGARRSASTGGREAGARSAGAVDLRARRGSERSARSAGAGASASTGGGDTSARSAEAGASASTGGCEVTRKECRAARDAAAREIRPPVHPKPEILVEPEDRGGPGRGRRRARFVVSITLSEGIHTSSLTDTHALALVLAPLLVLRSSPSLFRHSNL